MNTTPELDQSVIKATEQFVSQIDTSDAKETTSHCAHELELCFSDEHYTVLHNLSLLAQDEVFNIKHWMQKKRGEALHVIRSPMDKMKKCQQRVCV